MSDPTDADSGTHKARRSSGGARREASERVLLRRGNEEITGWTLNVSRGGVRIIVEDPLAEGDELEVQVGDEAEPLHPARVVWIKELADGQIVGVQFLDVEGSVPPSQPPPAME
ncbi:MAG: PilZ domain-containing protein [Polyangiaceae bacterium]|nr:PilZ domain-containing protein [Polyangiaceae bacterium]